MSLIIPNTFASRTGSIPLADLDNNFSYLAGQVDTTNVSLAGTAATLAATNISLGNTQGDLSDLTSTVNTAVGDLNTAESNITSLQGTVNNITGTLTITGGLSGFGVTPTASVGAVQVSGSVHATSELRLGAVGDTAYSGAVVNLSNTSKSVSLEADPTNVGASSLILFKIDNTERVRMNSSGQFLFGHTAALTDGYTGAQNKLQITSITANEASLKLAEFNAAYGGYGPSVVITRSKNSTIGSHGAIDGGTSLGGIGWSGSDGTAFNQCADIKAVATSTFTTNNYPTYLSFSTAPASGTLTERMKINSDGTVTMIAHINPSATNTYDLGSATYRWRNIYTNDLQLSNGIGDYTIVEGEDDLFLYNNKSGKVFKFMIQEVDPSVAPPKAV